MTKFETMDKMNVDFVALSESEMMETDGGLVITGPAIVGGLIVVGFGGLGLYLGSK
ncbi:TPA: bacteriocin [Streptococcus suis]|nr:bacteriocin [Streptococcus suis]